ncbi:hypothetical protein V6C27_09150 [Peptococcaceae bacterium 1198_IL3148]
MERIALSTSAFCLWDIGAVDKINICQRYNLSRIEVAISTFKMLKQLLANEQALNMLKSFDNVTIHAPWCGIKYGNNKKSREAIALIKELDRYLNVEAFIFHQDTIKNFSEFSKNNFNYYIENSAIPGSWPEFNQLMEEYKFPCVLDINRATRNDNYLEPFLDKYMENITEIHVSGFATECYRLPITTTNQSSSLNSITNLSVPIIVEGLFKPLDYKGIAEEINVIAEKIS